MSLTAETNIYAEWVDFAGNIRSDTIASRSHSFFHLKLYIAGPSICSKCFLTASD